MRFKTKDLMINVLPKEALEVKLCAYHTLEVTPPLVCPFKSDWCGPKSYYYVHDLLNCRAASRFPELLYDWTQVVRQATPQMAHQPEQLAVLKQAIDETQRLLADVEARTGVEHGSVANVKRVEAGLIEALSQVRARRKELAKKGRKKKA